MNGDKNPSIVCGVFCTPDLFQDMVKHIDGKHGMRVREIRFIDIGMPVDDRYNDAVNHLKHFADPILRRLADMDFMGMKEKLLNKAGLKSIQLPKWKTDNRHKLLYSGLTPLFIDDKYSSPEHYTEEEIENCKKLAKFESEGYEPIITGVYEK